MTNNTYKKSELLKAAHEKVSNMTVNQLNDFVFGDEYEPTSVESYSTGELVEIATYVPGFDFVFLGEQGIIYNIFKITNMLGLLVDEKKHNGSKTTSLPIKHVRKLSN